MSWLSKATGIHIGGNLGISKVLDSAYKGTFGKIVHPLSKFGEGVQATYTKSGPAYDAAKQAEREQIQAAKIAAHDAEVAQLAQNTLGSVNLRKRRGSYATMLTGSPMMGGSPGSTGKTLLSQ